LQEECNPKAPSEFFYGLRVNLVPQVLGSAPLVEKIKIIQQSLLAQLLCNRKERKGKLILRYDGNTNYTISLSMME
jgi:hypothetical protein